MAHNKKYDIFISYRCKKSCYAPADGGTYTPTSVPLGRSDGRAVKEALAARGFSVYFSPDAKEDYKTALRESRHVVVLLTDYSFEKDKAADDNFREELGIILNRLESGELGEDDVLWVSVDRGFNRDKMLEGECNGLRRYVTHNRIMRLFTDENFSHGIDDIANRIAKTPPLGIARIRKLCNVLVVALALAAVALTVTLGNLWKSGKELSQLKAPGVTLVGGGTVKNCMDSIIASRGCVYDAGTRYLPLPSKDAWSLLWDEKNRDTSLSGHVVVLSAERITNKDVRSLGARLLVEVKVGESPLMVQVYPDDSTMTTLSIDSLKRLIADTNYYIFTTSSTSGTYNAYVNNNGLDLTACGGRLYTFDEKKDFGDAPEGKIRLYLSNAKFYREGHRLIPLVDASSAAVSMSLYLYTVADDNKKLGLPVKRLIEQLGGRPDEVGRGNGVTIKHLDLSDPY